jgi:hypothetical protein
MMLPTFSPPPQTQQLPPFRYTNKLLTCLSPVENKNSCPHSLASILIGRAHSLVSYCPRFSSIAPAPTPQDVKQPATQRPHPCQRSDGSLRQ